MVTARRKGDISQVYAITKTGDTVLLAWQKTGADGVYTGHSANLAFFEKADGTLETSKYQLGICEAKKRRFVGTPGELEAAFSEAGLPAPHIVRREEMASGRSLRALIVATLGAPRRLIARPQ